MWNILNLHEKCFPILLISWLSFHCFQFRQWNKDVVPHRKVSNLWPPHWGSLWYNHLYNLTALSPWGYLTWQMGCVVTEMGSVCLCRCVYRLACRGVKEGLSAGGGDSALLSVNLGVNLWACHTHTHKQKSRNYFVINILSETLCCVCCASVLPLYIYIYIF